VESPSPGITAGNSYTWPHSGMSLQSSSPSIRYRHSSSTNHAMQAPNSAVASGSAPRGGPQLAPVFGARSLRSD
jgi:hypothetical protein